MPEDATVNNTAYVPRPRLFFPSTEWGPRRVKTALCRAMARADRSREDNRLGVQDEDPVREVRADRTRQHGALDRPAHLAQRRHIVPVVDPDHVLLDDRAGIEPF